MPFSNLGHYNFWLVLPSSIVSSPILIHMAFPFQNEVFVVLKQRINNIHDKQIRNQQKSPIEFCVACFQRLQTTLMRLCYLPSHLIASSPRGDGPFPLFPSRRPRRHASSSSLGSCAWPWTLWCWIDEVPLYWVQWIHFRVQDRKSVV